MFRRARKIPECASLLVPAAQCADLVGDGSLSAAFTRLLGRLLRRLRPSGFAGARKRRLRRLFTAPGVSTGAALAKQPHLFCD